MVSSQRARLVAILEATPDLVGIADASGRTVYLNRAARRLPGVGGDVSHALETIASIAVPALADFCLVDLGSGDGTRRMVATHHGPDRAAASSTWRCCVAWERDRFGF